MHIPFVLSGRVIFGSLGIVVSFLGRKHQFCGVFRFGSDGTGRIDFIDGFLFWMLLDLGVFVGRDFSWTGWD